MKCIEERTPVTYSACRVLIGAHHAEVECVPNILGVFVVLVRDVGVCQLRVEGLLGRELLIVHLLEMIHVPVPVHPLASEPPQIPRLDHDECVGGA